MNEAIDVVIETLNKAKGDIPSLDIEQANKELAAAKENLTAMEKRRLVLLKLGKMPLLHGEKLKLTPLKLLIKRL